MVFSSKSVVILVLAFASVLLFDFFESSLACSLASHEYYSECTSMGGYCVFSGTINAYDFKRANYGCVMGYAAGQFYTILRDPYSCLCGDREAKWYTSGSYNGQECKRKCDFLCEAEKTGKFDFSESKCVICDSSNIEVEYFTVSQDYNGDRQCESACGASSECDEISPPSSLPDICSETSLVVSRYCSSSCQYFSTTYTCSASNCGEERTCDSQTYYCVYDNGWKWSTSKPQNFCCGDSDCPANNNIKGRCNLQTRRCEWPPCEKDEDCVSGTYCYCGACGSSFTSAGCSTGHCCNRGYGGSGIGECVSKGTIYRVGSTSYLCDPPEESLEAENKSKEERNLFELILSFFYFFVQR